MDFHLHLGWALKKIIYIFINLSLAADARNAEFQFQNP